MIVHMQQVQRDWHLDDVETLQPAASRCRLDVKLSLRVVWAHGGAYSVWDRLQSSRGLDERWESKHRSQRQNAAGLCEMVREQDRGHREEIQGLQKTQRGFH